MTTPSFWSSEPIWVTKQEIREAFNTGGFLHKLAKGELVETLLRDKHARPESHEPYCTRSQMVAYKTPEGNLVALVHQYRRRDGKIGASGLPDPKRLLYNNRILAVRS